MSNMSAISSHFQLLPDLAREADESPQIAAWMERLQQSPSHKGHICPPDSLVSRHAHEMVKATHSYHLF